MTEGFGYGKMNNEGFNNVNDYSSEPIDILLMGSSQMEAVNVPQNRTTGSLLSGLFSGSKFIYNIGISGHDFFHIINNLEKAINTYNPKYVIIETQMLKFDPQTIEKLLTGNIQRIPSYDKGLIFHLQRFPYLRLLYRQYKYLRGQNEIDEPAVYSFGTINRSLYLEKLNRMIGNIHELGIASNVKPIILYHPQLSLKSDGSVYADIDAEYLGMFKAACSTNEINFVDMTEPFMRAYNEQYILPHGFWNTHIGSGHLNKNGHRIIATELYNLIEALDRDSQ
jgi:hypothetical protein